MSFGVVYFLLYAWEEGKTQDGNGDHAHRVLHVHPHPHKKTASPSRLRSWALFFAHPLYPSGFLYPWGTHPRKWSAKTTIFLKKMGLYISTNVGWYKKYASGRETGWTEKEGGTKAGC